MIEFTPDQIAVLELLDYMQKVAKEIRGGAPVATGKLNLSSEIQQKYTELRDALALQVARDLINGRMLSTKGQE